MNQKAKLGVSGAAAGLVNGLFGGGGGMVMAPLLTGWCGLEQKRALATCVGVILPFCVLSAAIYVLRGGFDWLAALPYLIGGAASAVRWAGCCSARSAPGCCGSSSPCSCCTAA